MKIGKYASSISAVIAIIIVILKVQFDLAMYNTINDIITNGDASPKLFVGGIKVMLLYGIPTLMSLILSIIGLKKKNKYRKIALVLNILTILYLIIPVGLIVSTF